MNGLYIQHIYFYSKIYRIQRNKEKIKYDNNVLFVYYKRINI